MIMDVGRNIALLILQYWKKYAFQGEQWENMLISVNTEK